MSRDLISHLEAELEASRKASTYRTEAVIVSKQGAAIEVGGRSLVNLCANNYLGLSSDQAIVDAAKAALDRYGYGLSSVRFICGTQAIHKELEERVSAFLGCEDALLFSSCFDANTGLFEALLGPEDAIVSDTLNHASIIDGIRLCKAQKFRYRNGDMEDLEAKLKEASGFRFRIIATDGVFSMDGSIAKLREIRDLADHYRAHLMVDDSHAVGVLGKEGRGTHEHLDLIGRIDILTGTFGKALGGASGGYVAGPKTVIEWLRQRSRPYLFSNSLAPMIVATTLYVLDLIRSSRQIRERLHANTTYVRNALTGFGFTLLGQDHPILPVLLKDDALALRMAEELLKEGIYVRPFSYPVVPRGEARIRIQISAAHTPSHLETAVEAFRGVGKRLGVLP